MPPIVNLYQFSLFRCLEDREKLALRATHRAAQAALKANTPIPYQTNADFCIAVSGFFFDQTIWMDAYACYMKTKLSHSVNPAILYKLGEVKMAIREIEADQQECLKLSGRQYDPREHTWRTNQVWMMAQIHKGRSFIVLSDATRQHVYRRTKGKDDEVSAFGREIAIAIKAGYTIDPSTYVTSHAGPYLRLIPPVDCPAKHQHIESFNPPREPGVLGICDVIYEAQQQLNCSPIRSSTAS